MNILKFPLFLLCLLPVLILDLIGVALIGSEWTLFPIPLFLCGGSTYLWMQTCWWAIYD